ncbi:MAG: WbqC family protein [Cyclobacteriaceae bacterium]|nr:WbqC family protein [Cyclobacteriaceae bacterium]
MSDVLIDLHYLPSLAYFCCFYRAENVIIEANENYVKQSFRNRTRILTANGVCSLSVPVVGGNKKTNIQEIKIDDRQKWINTHWRTIQSAYGKAPYFEYYADYFLQIYNEQETSLFTLNKKILTLCLKFLEMEDALQFSEKYVHVPEKGIIDLRSALHPKNKSGASKFYQPKPYIQLFGNEFVPNMSIVDLLFCEGPNARNIIIQSTKVS